MFPARYFASRFFPDRYFGKAGAEPTPLIAEHVLLGLTRMQVIVARTSVHRVTAKTATHAVIANTKQRFVDFVTRAQ